MFKKYSIFKYLQSDIKKGDFNKIETKILKPQPFDASPVYIPMPMFAEKVLFSSSSYSLKSTHILTRAESSLRSGVSQYYNISRTIWMIKSLKIVTYVLWLLTCCYMSWYCTILCNFRTSIWYS